MSRRSVPQSRPALFSRFALVILAVMAVAVPSCSRSVTLGYEEAIEVMVLDGLDRGRAECVVSSLDGTLALDKITGLDVDLDDDELALLAATSATCAPALGGNGGVIAGPPLDEAMIAAEIAASQAPLDVQAEVYRMVEEGLEPSIADCLILRLEQFPDPSSVLADPMTISEAIVDCRASLESVAEPS